MNKPETLQVTYGPYGQAREITGTETRTTPNVRRMTVNQMLAKFDYLPSQTAILGVCDDGLPLLFNLLEPHPGPMLITGDKASGKTVLMQGMLQSVLATNSSYEVKYAVVSSKPEEWGEFAGSKGKENPCMGVYGNYEDQAGEIIMRMSEIAEQRRSGREEGAALLLMIDDLRFMAKADFDVRQNFEWLLKNGPAMQVWPVVSLATASAMDMARMVSYFRTRLVGHMPENASSRLGLFPGLDSESLQSGKQFAVRVESQWVNFWLPALG